MKIEEFLSEWHDDSSSVSVHTSGSTGTPKGIRVAKSRMEASARLTCQFLGLHEGDTALLCLPLDYIAGKMMVVRALTCGLRLISVEPGSHPLDGVEGRVDFAAMVPLQVYNALRVPLERERLAAIGHLIIGGGAVDDAMARELALFPNAVWSTYGMTETLSHIALRRLSGPEATEWYTPLPSVSVSLDSRSCLVVSAPLVCPQTLTTNDVARLRPDGSFQILGRIDNVICSGGVKIQAEQVEQFLSPHTTVPLCVTHRPDPRLGQAVVLLAEQADTQQLEQLCRRVLPRYWQPRHIISVDRLPLTANGKIARKEAERIAAQSVP